LYFFAVIFTTVYAADEICPLTGKPIGAQGVKSLETFRTIAVLNQGRVKPVDTYAQSLLLHKCFLKRFVMMKVEIL